MNGLAFHFCGDDVYGPAFGTFNTLTFNGTNQQYNVMMQAPEAATITHVGFNFNTRTLSPGNLTFRIGNVGTDGNPGATIYSTVTIASNDAQITYGGANGAFSWIAIPSFTVTYGQLVCCTVISSTGTWDASNFITLNYQINQTTLTGNRSQFPYGSRGSARQDGVLGGMRSSTTAYGYPIKFISNIAPLFSTDVQGTRFTVPANLGGSVRLTGVRLNCLFSNNDTTNIRVASLIGTTTTPLLSYTIDNDQRNGSSNGNTSTLTFPSPINLTAGTQYVIGMNVPQNQVQWFKIDFSNAGAWGYDKTAITGNLFGTVSSGSYTTGNVWTDITTELYQIYPIFDVVNAGTGGGGGMVVHPGMAGGMRG